MLQPQIESAINEAIDGMVAPGLASLGFLRSPSSVVSARRVTVTATSLSLALVLADLFGPAVNPIPGHLHAAVSPTPQAGTKRAYTVTVTNADTGTPVNQASVTLRNFTTTGTVQTVGPLESDSSGTVTFNVALRPKITYQVDPSVTTGHRSLSRLRSLRPKPASTRSASHCWRTRATSDPALLETSTGCRGPWTG
jgi:hypothetical protein